MDSCDVLRTAFGWRLPASFPFACSQHILGQGFRQYGSRSKSQLGAQLDIPVGLDTRNHSRTGRLKSKINLRGHLADTRITCAAEHTKSAGKVAPRIVELRVIEDVKELSADVQRHAFCELGSLVK
jgi:hypothetical protein